jgi:hypothetical protein
MTDQIVELKKLVEDMSNEGIARSSITIGKRAQEYGQDQHITASRKLFSFSVDSNRLADVSFSARSRPDAQGFIKSRIGIWWWSDPDPDDRSTYEQTIDAKIKKAIAHGLVKYENYSSDKKAIAPGDVASVLSEIGSYDRSVFESVVPYMSRKIRSAFGSYVTDFIFNNFPDANEALDQVKDFSIKCPLIHGGYQTITGPDVLSQLESLSVVRRVAGKFLPFYAYEIFGADIEKLLEENVFDSHLDVVKNMIMKMPGLSKDTLMSQLPREAKSDVIERALNEMWRSRLVYVIKTENTLLSLHEKPKEIIIPTWFIHFIMDLEPQLVQTEAFMLSLVSLSWFWQSMRLPLEEFNEQIDNFNQFINSVCKGTINWREIYDLGSPISNLALTMSKTGLLLDKKDTDETCCLLESKPVLSAIQNALAHAYDSEIWFGGLSRPTSVDKVASEVQAASKEINHIVLEKWKPSKLIATIEDFRA